MTTWNISNAQRTICKCLTASGKVFNTVALPLSSFLRPLPAVLEQCQQYIATGDPKSTKQTDNVYQTRLGESKRHGKETLLRTLRLVPRPREGRCLPELDASGGAFRDLPQTGATRRSVHAGSSRRPPSLQSRPQGLRVRGRELRAAARMAEGRGTSSLLPGPAAVRRHPRP